MKRRSICLLLAVMIMALNTQAYASVVTLQEAPCYIASLDCPEDYIEYATENASEFIFSASANLNPQQISIGTPFAFADFGADVFYFPVLYNGHIQYLFRVYPSGDSYCGVISEFLADDIDALAGLTSVDNPMYLNCVGTKIVATIGSSSYELYEYPEDLAVDESTTVPMSADGYSTKNVKNRINIDLNLQQTKSARNISALIDITETQHGNDRCGAYCLAAIIRKLTTHTNMCAWFVINDAYDYPAHINSNWRLPWEDSVIVYDDDDSHTERYVKGVASVASYYGLYPTVLDTPAPNNELLENILNGRPCILRMMSRSTAVDHAVVLCGYTTSIMEQSMQWQIWNPWFNFYEHFPANGTYVPTGHNASTHTLYHRMTAYNF